METWFIIVVSLCLSFLIKGLLDVLPKSYAKRNKHQYPPGITISRLAWLWKYSSFHGPLPLANRLRSKFGSIFTIYVGKMPTIWISDPTLAHQALVKNGVHLADRFSPSPTHGLFNSNQHNVSSAAYGPTWQALRRNLASHFLSPTHIKSFSDARKWALHTAYFKSGNPVQVREYFLFTLFRLQCAMCFGLYLDESQVKAVQSINRRILLGLPRYGFLNAWPKLTKIFFASKWAELQTLRKELDDVYLNLIKARKEIIDKEKNHISGEKEIQYCYVDSLLELLIPNENGGGLRKLTDGEIVSLCNEFLNASTDLPSDELEWVMAYLVKYPQLQDHLLDEIKEVVGSNPSELQEEDLSRTPYLKAMILEVLRLHPPGHILIPHRVEQDMELGRNMVPKNASINVLVAEIGRDPDIWEAPMQFKPERLLTELSSDEDGKINTNFDLAGSKEIKMMPFGVGRRMCPGNVLARFNLEYFVANLVWHFEWKAVDGEDVDFSEKEVFTIMMKNPLKAQISLWYTS